MIKMFFQQKIPEKKAARLVHYILKTIFASFQLNDTYHGREKLLTSYKALAGPKFWMREVINRFNHHQVKNFQYQAVYQLNVIKAIQG